MCKREGVAMLPWSPLKGLVQMHSCRCAVCMCVHVCTCVCMCVHVHVCTCRGLLTGKFKRGEVPDPATSRVGWTTAQKKFASQSHPSLADYADSDMFWSLLSSMEDIASATG